MAIYRPKTLTVPSGSDSYKLRGLTDAEVTKLANAVTDISGKLDTSLKGAANGLAELDSSGKVPSSQLPSYVDDVEEYAGIANFPATGESSKIYIDTATNKTYRWSGTTYVPTSTDLALGETSSTAYRGDRGKTAYDHASDSGKIATAQTAGLYKVGITAEGHIASAAAVQKSDITALGIPGENTTYTQFTGATDQAAGTTGLVPAPAATAKKKFLCSDGTWTEEEGAKLITKELDDVSGSGGSYTHTTYINDVTEDMKAVMIEVSDADVFGSSIQVSVSNGSITLTCDEVNGQSEVTVSLMFLANASTLTSSEFDVLANRITSLEAVGVDIPMTIATTDWAADNGIYKYDWIDSNNRVTNNCRIKVAYGSAASASNPYLGYEKIAGGVRFTAPTLPTANIPVIVTILSTKAGVNTQLYADEVATDVISGAANVDEALEMLSGHLEKLFYCKLYQYSYTCGANQSVEIGANNFGITAISGYSPVAIQFYNIDNPKCILSRLSARFTDQTTTIMKIFNPTTSALSGMASIRIIWVKTDLYYEFN